MPFGNKGNAEKVALRANCDCPFTVLVCSFLLGCESVQATVVHQQITQANHHITLGKKYFLQVTLHPLFWCAC